MGGLAIPLVLWGRDPPTHDVSCILLTRDVKTLVTASRAGQICIWDFDPPKLKLHPSPIPESSNGPPPSLPTHEWDNLTTHQMMPRAMLVGHSAPVTCLAQGSTSSSGRNTLVSAAENGEFCVWDLRDGRCLELITSHNIHSSITPYQMLGASSLRLFTTGNYPEIHIYDPTSLQLLCTLSSRLQPDWIAAIHVLRPSKRNDEVVLGVTQGGWVKVWTVSDRDVVSGEGIKEHESKKIHAPNARCLVCCSYNQRTVLIVTPNNWQVYDAGDFSRLTVSESIDGETFRGGSFLTNETVAIWGDTGKAYIFKLPNNCVVGTKEFHRRQVEGEYPTLIGVCKTDSSTALLTPPSWQFQIIPVHSGAEKLLVRGDCDGGVTLWRMVDILPAQMKQLLSVSPVVPAVTKLTLSTSLHQAWSSLSPPPVGLLDHILSNSAEPASSGEGCHRVCSTLFLGSQGRVACGREDGSILLIPATEAIMLHLLQTPHSHSVSQRMVLRGHMSRVTCLLYPHGESSSRYPQNQLVSGGADFAVILWDLCSGAQLQRFVVQAGPVLQLMITPPTCSVRVQQCIVSVSGDHSVALISLKEMRVVLLAAHHTCPITAIKWRPLHDFLMVATSDGAVHVWQMDTGHLDRVVSGVVAEEILSACDELGGVGSTGTTGGGVGGDSQSGMANPAIHMLRGLRHRNLAAIRHAAQRGIQQVLGEQSNDQEIHDSTKMKCCPLLIQPLRTHHSDPQSHVLFVDIEALIVQLLADEYAVMSPHSLEDSHLTNTSHYHRLSLLTHPASPEAAKKIADVTKAVEVPSQTLHIGQLVMSVLHSWGLDADLDATCLSLLGMLKPRVFPNFGIVTKQGFMSLFLPTWHPVKDGGGPAPQPPKHLAQHLPPEMVKLQHATQVFSSRGHWEISSAVTTHHLLALIALANTMQDRNAATLAPEKEKSRRAHLQKVGINQTDGDSDFSNERNCIKQGWSTLTALHSVLLPDSVAKVNKNTALYQPPLLEILARRWQNRCQEIRDAAQTLLKTELNRLGVSGRQKIIEEWSHHLPAHMDHLPASHSSNATIHNIQNSGKNNLPPRPPPPSTRNNKNASDGTVPLNGTTKSHNGNNVTNGGTNGNEKQADVQLLDDYHFDDDNLDGSHEGGAAHPQGHPKSGGGEQGVAIILLAVIGAYHGHNHKEGFGLGSNIALRTSKALAHLLLSAPSARLPLHTPLRRAAIDLIGSGFPIWEPYLDVAKVVLALLELCTDIHQLAPSMKYGLPLVPEADSCRTASAALTNIASARPNVLITTLAREVARYNALQQNAQSLQMNLHLTTLFRAKTEILRLMEYLIQHHRASITSLMVEVMDIILHCVDNGHLRGGRPLSEVFPSVVDFPQVSHCQHTRRIATGANVGSIALYDLRHSKCQIITAHTGSVTAVAFSPDGKYLSSYSMVENKISFWQTSTGIFGLGSSQTKCTKSFSTVPVPDIVRLNPQRFPKLVWISNKTVVLMLADGTEHRFNA